MRTERVILGVGLAGLCLLACLSPSPATAQTTRRSAVLQPAGGQHWALLVGADKYRHIMPNLAYCGADVRALGENLVAAGFDRDCVMVLHDQAAPNL